MNLAEIRNMRRNIGLTQTELAKMAGVSQAFITRVESGKVDPSFTKVQKIFSALERIRTGLPKGAKIQDIMSKNVISVESKSYLRQAARIMKKKNISQLPVAEKGKIIGVITEADIAHAIVSKPERLSVEDLMKLPMPMIDIDSDVDVIVRLLDYSPAVLITKKGSIAGIVTRADMLKLIRR